MYAKTATIGIFLVLATGCSFSDDELESRIKQLTDADIVQTLAVPGGVVINVVTDVPFEMSEEQRSKLSKRIAAIAVELDPDRTEISVSFTKASGESAMIMHNWKNNKGDLALVK